MPTFGIAIRAIASRQGARMFRAATRDIQASAIGATVQVNRLNVATNRLGGSFGLIARSAAGFLGSIAALAGIRSTVKNISDFEEAITRTRIRMRLTTKEFDFFREGIRGIAVETRFTAVEVANSFEQLAKAGIRGAQGLEILQNALDLAAVGTLSAEQSTDILLKTLAQFRLDLNQSTRIVDVFTTVSDSLNATVGELGEGLRKVGPIARVLGIELETIVPVMGLLVAEMGSASRAGTGLKSSLAQISKFTSQTEDLLKSMGLTVTDFDVKARGLLPVLKTVAENFGEFRDKLKLVGTEAVLPLTILEKLGGKINELNKKSKENIGITREMAEAFEDNLGGAFRRLISSITDLQLEIGDQGLLGILRKTVDFTRDVVNALKGQKDEFVNTTKSVLLAKEAIVSFTGALVFLGTAAAIKGIAAMVLALNPVTLAIGAAAAAIILLRNETVEVGGVTTTVGHVMIVVWEEVARVIRDVFGIFIKTIKASFSLLIETRKELKNMQKAGEGAAAGMGGFLNVFIAFQKAMEEGKPARDSVVEFGTEIAMAFVGAESASERFVRRLKELNDELEKLKKPPPEFRGGITPVGEDIGSGAVRVTKELTDQQRSAIRFADDLGTSMTDAFGAIITGAETAGEAIRNLIDKLAELILQQVLLQPLANAISFGLVSTLGGAATIGAFAPASLNPANIFIPGGGPRFGAGSGGGVRNFQKGGIINGPTVFRDGLAGEAGPEAILPLKRGPTGELGVAGSERNITVNMQIVTPNADSFRRSNRQIFSAARLAAIRLQ